MAFKITSRWQSRRQLLWLALKGLNVYCKLLDNSKGVWFGATLFALTFLSDNTAYTLHVRYIAYTFLSDNTEYTLHVRYIAYTFLSDNTEYTLHVRYIAYAFLSDNTEYTLHRRPFCKATVNVISVIAYPCTAFLRTFSFWGHWFEALIQFIHVDFCWTIM